MLNNQPRTELIFIVKKYGQIIITEPKRCKGLLNDLTPEYVLENNLLIKVLEKGAVEELLNPSDLISIEMLLKRLAKNLHDTVGMDENFAYWAVESWALALNIIEQPIEFITPIKTTDINQPISVSTQSTAKTTVHSKKTSYQSKYTIQKSNTVDTDSNIDNTIFAITLIFILPLIFILGLFGCSADGQNKIIVFLEIFVMIVSILCMAHDKTQVGHSSLLIIFIWTLFQIVVCFIYN